MRVCVSFFLDLQAVGGGKGDISTQSLVLYAAGSIRVRC